MQIRATVSTKGQVTLPAALRAKLGIQAGSLLSLIHISEPTRPY